MVAVVVEMGAVFYVLMKTRERNEVGNIRPGTLVLSKGHQEEDKALKSPTIKTFVDSKST